MGLSISHIDSDRFGLFTPNESPEPNEFLIAGISFHMINGLKTMCLHNADYKMMIRSDLLDLNDSRITEVDNPIEFIFNETPQWVFSHKEARMMFHTRFSSGVVIKRFTEDYECADLDGIATRHQELEKKGLRTLLAIQTSKDDDTMQVYYIDHMINVQITSRTCIIVDRNGVSLDSISPKRFILRDFVNRGLDETFQLRQRNHFLCTPIFVLGETEIYKVFLLPNVVELYDYRKLMVLVKRVCQGTLADSFGLINARINEYPFMIVDAKYPYDAPVVQLAVNGIGYKLPVKVIDEFVFKLVLPYHPVESDNLWREFVLSNDLAAEFDEKLDIKRINQRTYKVSIVARDYSMFASMIAQITELDNETAMIESAKRKLLRMVLPVLSLKADFEKKHKFETPYKGYLTLGKWNPNKE